MVVLPVGVLLCYGQDMLALVLTLVAVLRAGLGTLAISTVRPRFSTVPTMPRSLKPLGAASCADDIEELPAAFVRDYRQHQAVAYHAFTAEEVNCFVPADDIKPSLICRLCEQRVETTAVLRTKFKFQTAECTQLAGSALAGDAAHERVWFVVLRDWAVPYGRALLLLLLLLLPFH